MQGTAIWLTAERKEWAYETNFHHIVVGRFDFLSSDGTADGSDTDRCRGSAERDAEKDFQGPREDAEENHCSGNGGHGGHGQDAQGGGQDAGVSFQCAGCDAEPLSDQAGGRADDGGDSSKHEPIAPVATWSSERNGHCTASV